MADACYYPDVMVACDAADRHEYYRERPLLLVEVTSPSTETRGARLPQRLIRWRPPAIMAITAMRIPMPFLTCSRITDRGP